jgi:hypothetical protein
MKRVLPHAPRRGTLIPLQNNAFDLSIDPGESTGWALFQHGGGRLVACGGGEPPFGEDISLDNTAIELPQSYPGSPVPPQDLITLAFLAGQYARAAGDNVFVCFPHAWKGNLDKDVCGGRVMKNLSLEERAIVAACKEHVPAKQMHNVLDAIGVGLVAFRGVKL